MVDEKEKQIEEATEVKTKNKEKLFRIIGTLVSIIVLIILIVIKSQRPEFPLFWFLGFILLIIIFFISMFWGFSLYRRYQEAVGKKELEGKLPPAITIEQAAEIIEKQLKNPRYSDYVTGWVQHKIYVIGRNEKCKILVVQLETVYSVKPYQFYIINLNFPEMWTFVCQDKYNQGEISRAVNSLAISPEDEPDERETISENLLTGNKITTRERIKALEKIEKKEKKGDLE